jgi:hypothetical protein
MSYIQRNPYLVVEAIIYESWLRGVTSGRGLGRDESGPALVYRLKMVWVSVGVNVNVWFYACSLVRLYNVEDCCK